MQHGHDVNVINKKIVNKNIIVTLFSYHLITKGSMVEVIDQGGVNTGNINTCIYKSKIGHTHNRFFFS